MNILKSIFLPLIRFVKQLPQAITYATQQRQQQTVLNEAEAERLDRIRHPSKYLGK